MRELLDPELASIVAGMRARGITGAFNDDILKVRARFAAAVAAARASTPLPEVGSVEDRIAVHDGREVPVRIYRPIGVDTAPTCVFFHGGGFMLGSVELMDDIARKLCRDTGVIIVSVDYRLAPEHRFPAAHEDAFAATSWMIEQGAKIGGNGVFAVIGESAGANLAASTALLLRDRGVRLAAQLLDSPGLDFARDLQRIDVPPGDFPMLTCADLRIITSTYLGEADPATFPPSPMRAADLTDSPPTIIAVAGCDPLQSEGIAYAKRLQAAGVPTIVRRFADMFHPFLGFFAASRSAAAANDLLCADLSQLLCRSDARSVTQIVATPEPRWMENL